MNDPKDSPPYQIRDILAEMVAVGVYAYIHDYTRRLFTNVLSPEAQDLIAEGISRALLLYQKQMRSHTATVIAYNLLDNTKDSHGNQSSTLQ